MEQALGTTIPYWDSSIDFEMDDPATTILFTARYFGNGFGFVTNGPFATLPGRSIIRNIGGDGTLISKQAIASVLSRTRHAEIVEPSTADTVQFSLEAHHNGPHVWVDGTLASLNSAAYDPIFFCHHAFVDYIWELFRRRIPNAQFDYPPTPIPGHGPLNFMDFGDFPFAPRIQTSAGYSDQYARLRAYQPAPSCPTCAGSPDLICVSARGVCVSRAAPPETRMAAPAARVNTGTASAAGFAAAVVPAADAVEPDTPQRARNAVMQTGPLQTGPKFVSPFRDGRTRGESLPVAPADPSLTRGKRSTFLQKTSNLAAFESDKTSSTSDFERRPDMPYQNTFEINGRSDVKLWAFMPIKVIYVTPPRNDTNQISKQPFDITDIYEHDLYKGLQRVSTSHRAIYSRCSPGKPAPDRVFVQSDGIDYSGRYKDFAKIDPNQPISSSFTYIGIKKPTNNSSPEAMITAYDTCGRVCRARCLELGSDPPVYKSCAGSVKADERLPLMYDRTYAEAIFGLWRLWESNLLAAKDDNRVPIMFICDQDASWPWYEVRP